jgi:alpha-amylase
LPDLNDDGNSWVRSELISWVRWIIQEYDFDGIRIDTIPHMGHGFWKDFTASAAVYSVGECLNSDAGYVFGYLDGMDGMLNYPLRSKFYGPFKNGSFKGLGYGIQELLNYPGSEAIDSSGSFVDNHDNPRFLYNDGNWDRFMGALAFTLMFKGIPIVYYGSEQGYGGGADPDNREPLWTNMDRTTSIYQFIKTVISTRKKYQIWNKDYKDIWRADNSFVFSRGEVLCIFTNGNKQQEMSYPGVPYSDGQRLCNIFDGGDCVTVSGGKISVSLPPDCTKIFVPA